MEDAIDHLDSTNPPETNFSSSSPQFECFAKNDFGRLIQIPVAVHRMGIFERAAIVFGIELRAIVTRKDEPILAGFVAQTIIDAVDHAGRE